MRGEHDRRPLSVIVANDLLENVLIDRIQTREGLIENKQLWLMDHRANELNLLLHTLREILDLLVSPFGQAQPVKPSATPSPSFAAPQSSYLSKEGDQLKTPHLLIDTALLRKVPHLRPPNGIRIFPEERDSALVRTEDAHDHSNAGRLARAIRPQ